MTADDRDLRFSSIKALGALIRQREISASELTQIHLEACNRFNGMLGGFATLSPERALRAAATLDRELTRKQYRGPLHGIPVGIKDVIDTEGIETSAGSHILKGRVPSRDATSVARLRAAGAVVLGKQTTFEFALGRPDSSDRFPPARNPWSLERATSGSSSGSAVSLAAGLCAGALGSDTGGSIRCPAAYAGVVGLKPSFGLIDCRGLIPVAWSLDHIGPMGRTVDDVDELLRVMIKPVSSRPVFGPPATRIKVGVPLRLIESRAQVDSATMSAFHAALEVLRDIGCEIVDFEAHELESIDGISNVIVLTEAAAFHEEWLTTRPGDYGPGVREKLPAGLLFGAHDYLRALRGRAALCRAVRRLMATIDVVATPTLVEAAALLQSKPEAPRFPQISMTQMFNLTGQPSVSVPCGFDDHGVPLGLLLSGRVFEDRLVLDLAKAYEDASGWHNHHPSLADAI